MRTGYYDNNGTFHKTVNLGWLMRHAHDVYRVYIARSNDGGGYLIALLQGKDDRVKTIFFSDFASYEVLREFAYSARRVWNQVACVRYDLSALDPDKITLFCLVPCDAPYLGNIIRYSGYRWQLEGVYTPTSYSRPVSTYSPMQNAYNWFVFTMGHLTFRFGGNQ